MMIPEANPDTATQPVESVDMFCAIQSIVSRAIILVRHELLKLSLQNHLVKCELHLGHRYLQ